MAFLIDVDLTESELAAMAAIPTKSWFSQFIFRNAKSPVHPTKALAMKNELKQAMVSDWITKYVKGKRVLDVFSANGGFSITAALAGAKEVVGVEFSQGRIECADFVAGTIRSKSDCKIEFIQSDVYNIRTLFDEPFDIVLCLGGLYHVADPAHVLKLLGSLTKERLILQTAQVLRRPGNSAKFIVRRQDRGKSGLTSLRGGHGAWHYTAGCLRELLLHGGFKVVEERNTPLRTRRRVSWFVANCEPL